MSYSGEKEVRGVREGGEKSKGGRGKSLKKELLGEGISNGLQ